MNNDAGLLLLFLYSIPCEFLVSLAPHEPAILYLAGDHLPIVIAIVAGAGTFVAEVINYEVLRRISRSRLIPTPGRTGFVASVANRFARAQFATLWIAGFLPFVPFSVLRPLAVLSDYPRGRYLLAAVSSRTLRFYFVALFGRAIHISPQVVAIVFAALLLAVTLPGLYGFAARRRTLVGNS